ncbi:MAG: YdcH family protein [Alphaproteobacteria bacterium]|nr:YdcH family protein [Alphaproteobacteria bacterium]
MAEDARLSALKSEHASLENQIQEEMGRPLPDDSLVHTLKKKKLHIKDELASLQA